jgi:ABC-type transport system substrate-binding protein
MIRAFIVLLVLVSACSNNPYPSSDDGIKVRYAALPEWPKTLDPAVSYSALDHVVIGNVYDTLLEYHYLARPYQMMPGLAEAVPEAEPRGGGRLAYRFRLRPGMRFEKDPCFALADGAPADREIAAADVAFELMRIADPAVISPVVATFSKVVGFEEFATRLADRRANDPGFGQLRIDRQYAAAGGIAGVVVRGPYELEIVVREPYPQMLYWFAMPFTAPVPWEAVAYYDGNAGRPFFKEHPVASGPFRLARSDQHSRIVLERNPSWYGALHPEWRAPGAIYPSAGEPGDAENGRLRPDYVGRPLPFLDRIEYRIDKEDIASFNKFLQGYYDASGIIQESFDRAIQNGGLSPAMAARGMSLAKSVEPAIFYIGFNMKDPIVGSAGGARARNLRQAMSLAIDSVEFLRIFNNGRDVPAQSPIPPGIFGYDPDYTNPYRKPDLARARALLAEAGYRDGIDPKTQRSLHLTFDAGSPDTRSRLRYQFWVDSWRKIGIDVEIAAQNYNAFQEKVRRGAFQIYTWGWIADYPDPENFLFLLWGPNANSLNPGAPNTSSFADPRFDALFLEMRDMPNGPERMRKITEMRAILERERPWIELSHTEAYALYHGWMRNVKPAGMSLPTGKYVDVDPERRRTRREEWNRPIVWPAWALAAAFVMVVVPGVVTFFRERQ